MQKKSFTKKKDAIYSNQNVSLVTNHFKISFNTNIIIQMYKVEIVTKKSLEKGEYEEIPKDAHFLKDKVIKSVSKKLNT